MVWNNTSFCFKSVEQSQTADWMPCETNNNLPVELDVFVSGFFTITVIYIGKHPVTQQYDEIIVK